MQAPMVRFGIETGTVYEASQMLVWAYTDKPSRICPWDREDMGQYVMVCVPDDDGGIHAGEYWMVPTMSIPRPDITVKPSLFHQLVIDDAASRTWVDSEFVAKVESARYYVPSVQVTVETARLFTKVADLKQCRYVPPYGYDDLPDGSETRDVTLFSGHGDDRDDGKPGIRVLLSLGERTRAVPRPASEVTVPHGMYVFVRYGEEMPQQPMSDSLIETIGRLVADGWSPDMTGAVTPYDVRYWARGDTEAGHLEFDWNASM